MSGLLNKMCDHFIRLSCILNYLVSCVCAPQCMCLHATVCVCVCTHACHSVHVSVRHGVYVCARTWQTCSPCVLHDKIQRVISCSACLVCKFPKLNLATSLFSFHWLPTSSRIQSKLALTCSHIASGTAPQYLICFFFVLFILFAQPSILGSSVFLGWAGGPMPMGRDPLSTLDLWSELTLCLSLSMSGIPLNSLMSKLKTHLFSSAPEFVVSFSYFLVTHRVCVCVCVCVDTCLSVGLCKHSRFLQSIFS